MQTRVARAPRPRGGRAQRLCSIIFRRRRFGTSKTIYPEKNASRTPLIPSLRREECLDLTPRLLAENREAPEALNPEYISVSRLLRSKTRGVPERKPLLINERLGDIPTVSPHCLKRHCTCSARADSAEARVLAAGRLLLVFTACFRQVPSCWCCIEQDTRY